MQSVLIVIHLIIVLALVGVVLLQRSEGGGLGLGGGGSGPSGFLTGRGQANVLTRTTAILAALFFATSLILSILAGFNRQSRSILDGVQPSGSSAPAPAGSGSGGQGVLDDLRRLQGGQEQQPSAPAAPAAPSTPQVPQSR